MTLSISRKNGKLEANNKNINLFIAIWSVSMDKKASDLLITNNDDFDKIEFKVESAKDENDLFITGLA